MIGLFINTVPLRVAWTPALPSANGAVLQRQFAMFSDHSYLGFQRVSCYRRYR